MEKEELTTDDTDEQGPQIAQIGRPGRRFAAVAATDSNKETRNRGKGFPR